MIAKLPSFYKGQSWSEIKVPVLEKLDEMIDAINAFSGGGLIAHQEEISHIAISGTDTTIVNALSVAPFSNFNLLLVQKGVLLQQGAGKDYVVSGRDITWLGSSGTAIPLQSTDILLAYYYATT